MTMAICPVCGKEFKKKRWNQKCCSKQCNGVAVNKKVGTKDTLCWWCKNTNANDCPWFSRKEEPVPGWVATPTTLKVGRARCKEQIIEIRSYRVHECPLFEPQNPLSKLWE